VTKIENVSGQRLTSEQLARLRAAVAAFREAADAYEVCENEDKGVKGGASLVACHRLERVLSALGLTAVPPELWDGEAGE
jgi:hypothetical protein